MLGITFTGIILLFMANLALGSVKIPLRSLYHILQQDGTERITWTNIIMRSRMPQTITAMLAGAGLSIGGLMMQTLFRNPLAGPSILGISSGASLGVAFVILFSGNIAGVALSRIGIYGNIAVTLAAFVGALAVLLLVLFLARKIKGNATLLIIGIMVGYTTNAVVGMLKFYSMQEDIHAYVIWGLGSFAKVSPDQMKIFAPVVIAGLLLSLLMGKSLNILLLGENYARNLGLNIRRSRWYIILCTGVLTATITAYCGPIIFLGLAVPHLARNIFVTSDHRILLPAVTLTGALLALLCNLIARMPGFDGALPINSITSMMGAPVVIWILFQKRKVHIQE